MWESFQGSVLVLFVETRGLRKLDWKGENLKMRYRSCLFRLADCSLGI